MIEIGWNCGHIYWFKTNKKSARKLARFGCLKCRDKKVVLFKEVI